MDGRESERGTERFRVRIGYGKREGGKRETEEMSR